MQSSLRRKQCTIKRGALMQEARVRVVRAVFALLGVVSGVGSQQGPPGVWANEGLVDDGGDAGCAGRGC